MLVPERYGAERGAIKRRTSELARRVPSRGNAKEIMKKIILARHSLTLVSAKHIDLMTDLIISIIVNLIVSHSDRPPTSA